MVRVAPGRVRRTTLEAMKTSRRPRSLQDWLLSEPKLWLGAALAAAFLTCLLLLGLYAAQRREISRATEILQGVRMARIDLAKSALKTHSPAAAEGGSAQAEGLALLDQARAQLADSLQAGAARGAAGEEAALTEDELSRRAADYRRETQRWLQGEGDAVALRLAHGALERFAERVDVAQRRQLAEVRERARLQFLATLLGIAAMLGIVCVGVFRAAREQARAAERIRLAAESAGVDFWDEDLRTGALRWWRDRALALAETPAPETFAALLERAVSESDRATLAGVREAALAGHRETLVEVRLRRRDGSDCWVMVRAACHHEAGGAAPRVAGTLVDVTPRKREEEARGELVQRFRQLYELVPVGLIYARRDGALNSMNRRAGQLLGYTIEEISPIERWWPLAYPDPDYRALVQQQWTQDLEQAHREGTDLPLREYRIVTKVGRTRIMELSGTLLDDEVLIVLQDITDRRQAEARSRFHEALLEETGRIAKVGGWSFDPKTGEGYWTNEVARIHDLDPATVTSRDFGLQFYTGESRARIEAALQAALERAEPYDLQLELVTAAGVPKWVRTIGHPVLEHGRVVRVRGSFQDITERRRVEQSLRESEELFRQMAENVDEVFWMTDVSKHTMLYVSPAYARIWGRSCESLRASPRQWLDSIHANDRERVERALARQIEGTYAEEYRIHRPDGAVRWIADRAFPVRDEAGRVFRLVGVARDITENRRLEEQFLRAQRMEAVGTLASGVAHDLNNILAPMLMIGALLRHKLPQPADQKLLGLVEQSAQRGAAIVAQLLTFSRGLSGERIELRVEHLVGEMLHLIAETFPRNITATRELARDLPAVLADPTQIHQVLMNLCVNARDAMPEGGQLTLGLRATQVDAATAARHPGVAPGPFLVLTVSDSGTGIPESLRTRIFDPFFTTKEIGKGTGLGLATVMGIVRSHGGFIELTSELGRGTRFDVFLPSLTQPEVPRAAAAPETSARNRGETILVVDDEEAICSVAKAVLELEGYRVHTAPNGQEALALFRTLDGRIDLLVSDVMMPGIDGWELAATLRLSLPDLPIVLSSGLDQKILPEALRAAGVSALLHKPFDARELREAVRRALEAR